MVSMSTQVYINRCQFDCFAQLINRCHLDCFSCFAQLMTDTESDTETHIDKSICDNAAMGRFYAQHAEDTT